MRCSTLRYHATRYGTKRKETIERNTRRSEKVPFDETGYYALEFEAKQSAALEH